MPTIILLDNSLSMLKSFNNVTKKDLAFTLINKIVNQFSKNDKFEYLALVSYSSTAQIVCEFTRDYEKLLDALKYLKIGDSACLEEGLNKISDLVIDEWACFTNIQVLLITDNIDSLSYNSSIRYLCNRLKENRILLKEYYLSNGIDFDEKIHINSILNEDILKSTFYANLNRKNYFICKYPFSFPNKFDIICLNSDNANQDLKDLNYYGFDDDNFKLKKTSFKNLSKIFYLNELVELNNNSKGSLYITKNLNHDYFKNEFCNKILNDLFNPFNCKLKCGHLESNITLIPAPIAFKGHQTYSYVEKEIWHTFEVCGFINISDLTTPPTLSRHLIALTNSPTQEKNLSKQQKSELVIETSSEDDKEMISFAILLHSSLKSEGMAAIVHVGNEWFGAVHCLNESKNDPKKNLMLTLFVPGNDVLQNIITNINNKPATSSAAAQQTSKSSHVKSYSKGCIVWYRQDNLMSDLQKIVRNAKKMQDKMPIFYKELNRVRKAALSFGFYDLFEGIALMLQRELNNMSSTNNPEILLQLQHCINCLRLPEFKEFRKDISPFVTNAPFTRKLNK